MERFEYARPETLDQAVALLAEAGDDARLLAGGTDLLSLLKDGIERPRRLVDVKRIAGLSGVAEVADARQPDGPGLEIGALVTLRELARQPLVVRHQPTLAWAAGHAAGPQIRSRGTLGGNLCQRPRCWYFRRGFGLVPRLPDERSMVRAGDDRYHAILGNQGDALFVSPSTVVPLLVALGARVAIVGPGGRRELPLGGLYRTPAGGGEREIALAPGEILTSVVVPLGEEPRPDGGRRVSASYEVRQRRTLDWSLATAAVALELAPDGPAPTVSAARIVLGQVAPVPWLADGAAAALVGRPLDDAAIERAADAAVADARALERNRYKIELARTAVARALRRAAGPAGEEAAP